MSPTLNLLQGLALAGQYPIFFHYDCQIFAGNRELTSLSVEQWPLLSLRRWLFKASGFLARLLGWQKFELTLWPLRLAAKKIVRQLRRTGVRPLCMIGIEKQGLVLAALAALELQLPFIYHSLELYGDGHPAFSGNREFKEWRRMEMHYHRLAVATIIQDEFAGPGPVPKQRLPRPPCLLHAGFPDGADPS